MKDITIKLYKLDNKLELKLEENKIKIYENDTIISLNNRILSEIQSINKYVHIEYMDEDDEDDEDEEGGEEGDEEDKEDEDDKDEGDEEDEEDEGDEEDEEDEEDEDNEDNEEDKDDEDEEDKDNEVDEDNEVEDKEGDEDDEVEDKEGDEDDEIILKKILNKKKIIHVFDFFNIIKNMLGEKTYKFEEIYKIISSEFKEILIKKKLSEVDILKAYITIFLSINNFGDDFVDLYVNKSNKKYIKEIDKREIINKITNITEKVKKEDEILNNFEKILVTPSSVTVGKFIPNRHKISRKLEVKVSLNSILNILELFNCIILNEYVLYASYGDFFKIYSKLTEKKKIEEWYNEKQKQNTSDLQIVVKCNNEYINIIINNNFEIEYEYENKTNEIDIIKKFGTMFDTDSENLKIKEDTDDIIIENKNKDIFITLKDRKSIGLYGYFDIEFDEKPFNKYVMSDLIMNNNLVSYYLTNDESRKTDKKKYIIQYNDMKNKITFQMSPQNNIIVRMSISSRILRNIERFINILSKIVMLYMKEYDNINILYSEYIDIGIEKEKEKEKDDECIKLLTGGNCRKPSIEKSEKEVIDALSSNKQVLLNRKNNCKFVCKDNDFKYPGVKDSKPCCYKTNKNKTPISGYIIFDSVEEYKKYEYKDEDEDKEEDKKEIIKKSQQKYIMTSNSILDDDKVGDLPLKIKNYFNNNLENKHEHEYKRLGMEKSVNSFIQCISKAINNSEYDYNDLRSEFTKNINLCRQECYDKTYLQIKEILEKENEYFNPRKYIRLLEEHFDVNIFIFQRDKLNEENLILPDHEKQYYKFKNDREYIFILEHYGSIREEKEAKHPQCELIVLWNKIDEKYTYKFNVNDDIVQQTLSIYNELNNIIYINSDGFTFENNKTYFNNYEVKYQVFDIYGKTRVIVLKVYDLQICLYFLEPIPPLNVEEIPLEATNEFDLYDHINTNSLINRLDIKNHKKNGDKIEGTIYGFEIYLKLNTESVNLSKNFNSIKRIARYTINYIFWLYSIYIDTNKENSFDDFIDKNIIIDTNFDYNEIEIPKNKLSYENTIMRDSKLVIKTTETLERLLYVLKLKKTREHENLLKFKDKKRMDNYYIDINDFDSNPNNILLKGFDFTMQWIKDAENMDKKLYVLYDVVRPRSSQYFIKFNDKTYYVHNSKYFETCVKVSYLWDSKGYIEKNIEDDIDINRFKIILYSYVNMKDIKKYIINQRGDDCNINIIGYLIEGEKRFISLLERLNT